MVVVLAAVGDVEPLPLGPVAGAVAKKVVTAVVTGASFATLDAGLSSLGSKAQPEPTTPAPKPVNQTPDIMIVIVCTTGASVFLVFLILLTYSLVKVLNAKLNPTNDQ